MRCEECGRQGLGRQRAEIAGSERRPVGCVIGVEPGAFEPRDVKLGMRGDGMTEITQGVAEGDRVVVAANFLIDAESNLKAALSALTPAEAKP